MASGDRELLIEALGERFIPLLAERGFVLYPIANKESVSGELRAAFPFGQLKRTKGSDVELLEIQFDKVGAARFVINIGVVPPGGVILPWGHFASDIVIASGLPEAYRLHSGTIRRSWFSLGWLPVGKVAKVAKAVNH